MIEFANYRFSVVKVEDQRKIELIHVEPISTSKIQSKISSNLLPGIKPEKDSYHGQNASDENDYPIEGDLEELWRNTSVVEENMNSEHENDFYDNHPLLSEAEEEATDVHRENSESSERSSVDAPDTRDKSTEVSQKVDVSIFQDGGWFHPNSI